MRRIALDPFSVFRNAASEIIRHPDIRSVKRDPCWRTQIIEDLHQPPIAGPERHNTRLFPS
jgi:hypothetical protein